MPTAQTLVPQIAVALSGNVTGQISVMLVPDDLGAMRLTIQPVENGNQISVSFDNPETLAAARREASALAMGFGQMGYANPQIEFVAAEEADDGPPDREEVTRIVTLPVPLARGVQDRLDLRL